jgi:glycosyltransferase involved in cell wall biosynthesis
MGNDNSIQSAEKPKILYLRPSAGAIPLNALTATLLQSEFPEYEVHTVDVRDLVKSAKLTIAINIFMTIWLYKSSLVKRRKSFRQCFWRTPYLFKRIHKLIRKSFSGQDWAFTFQIQSLFDGSMDGTPHYVYTDHTHLANLRYPGFDRERLFASSWIECEHDVYQNATIVFTMSTNMSHSVALDYGVSPDKVVCVYSGPNIEVGTTKTTARDDTKIDILFVGVDWQRKGGDLLVSAFSKLQNDYPSIGITIVGCVPPGAGEFDRRIVVKGRVPIGEVSRYFETADIFCMPTRLEPFGIVFIEAMAYGLPIISTRVGALPDLVEDHVNGILVDSEDVDSLAAALQKLIDNPKLRRDMGRSGRQRYVDQFNWTKVYSNIRDRIIKQDRMPTDSAPTSCWEIGN